jgi:hypothetical protein
MGRNFLSGGGGGIEYSPKKSVNVASVRDLPTTKQGVLTTRPQRLVRVQCRRYFPVLLSAFGSTAVTRSPRVRVGKCPT